MTLSLPRLVSTVACVVVCFVASKEIPETNESKVLSDIVIPLTNDNWTLWSRDEVFTDLKASVPGDLLSDLMINGLIDDPYIDRNFITQDKVWTGNDGNDESTIGRNSLRKRTWIYSTTFDIPESVSLETSWKVVLEGIKMGADVLVNGQKIGQVIDQFLRYDLEIGNDVLQKGVLYGRSLRRHNLTISFDPAIRVNGRFAGK